MREPPGLPLLLATVRIPRRWMWAGVPVLFVGTTAAVAMLGSLFMYWP
ncbi:hypothetical protein [Actinoplanes sp. NPDC026619]